MNFCGWDWRIFPCVISKREYIESYILGDIAKIHNNEKRFIVTDDSSSIDLSLLQVVNDGSCELVSCCVTTKILCLNFSSFQHVVDGTVDLKTIVSQVNVTQHF